MDKLRRKPTIKDVAHMAGVSIGTVSRVVNRHPRVTFESQQSVMAAVKTLGYEPNFAAQTMRTQTKKAIGLMVNDISNPLFSLIARHAETVFQDNGFSLVLANSGERVGAEAELVQQFFAHRTDGLLMNMSDETNQHLVQALQNSQVPTVLMDREPAGVNLDRVMTDHSYGMEQAADYLLKLGHKRIALITADQRISPGRARIEGYKAAHAAAGINVDPGLIRARSLSAAHGFQEMFLLWNRPERPTAVIAGGNQILLGVLRAARQLRIAVPKELSLISCDETELAELVSPPVTVIWRDLALVGRTAADLLLQRISGRRTDVPQRIVLPTELRVRESCGPPMA